MESDVSTPAFNLSDWLTAVDARLARFDAQIRDVLFVESVEDLSEVKESQFQEIGIGGVLLNKLMRAVAAAAQVPPHRVLARIRIRMLPVSRACEIAFLGLCV